MKIDSKGKVMNYPVLDPEYKERRKNSIIKDRDMGLTLAEVGERWNITKERVRQIDIIGRIRRREQCLI